MSNFSADVIQWLGEKRTQSDMVINFIPLEECDPWRFDNGFISRDDNRFFSIVKINNPNDSRNVFISQPEIGILGFIFLIQDGIPSIVVQAKDEPGNIGVTQLAPTVQATFSNYIRAHDGKPTKFLHYFLEENFTNQRSGSLQSEQGNKFWQKQNSNVTIFFENTQLEDLFDHKIFSIRDFLKELDSDYVINTDARSVLATTDWGRLLMGSSDPFHKSADDISIALRNSFYKESTFVNYNLNSANALVAKVRNSEIRSLTLSGFKRDELSDESFSSTIKFIDIATSTREVERWSQPIFMSFENEVHLLVMRIVESCAEFLIKVSIEPGLINGAEFGPTISAFEGDTCLDEIFINVEYYDLASVWQSDEGGRFFQNISNYKVRVVDHESSKLMQSRINFPNNLIWVNLKTLNLLLMQPGTTTNELRTASSLLLKWL